jgi:hypothetical protein
MKAAWLLLPIAWCCPARSDAAPKNLPIQRRACDMLMLSSGERLLGIRPGPARSGIVALVVERAWLAEHEPALLRDVAAGEIDRARAHLDLLRDRITAWREERRDQPELTDRLSDQLDRVDRRLRVFDEGPPEPSQLLMLEFPAADVKREFVQTPENRRVLALAWQEHLEDAVEESVSSLTRQLIEKGVDVDRDSPDLSDRVAAFAQDERQWAARVALVEYEMQGRPHFQGIGASLVRVDSESAEPDLSQLIQGLLGSDVESQLAELLGSPRPAPRNANSSAELRDALREADADGFRGVRVTRLGSLLDTRLATVEGRFMAKMPDGRWLEVWRHEASADAATPRPEVEEQLRDDPQVAEALRILSGLGLEADASAVGTAMRHGAAVKEALDGLNGAFGDFVLQYTTDLAGPPVWLADPE